MVKGQGRCGETIGIGDLKTLQVQLWNDGVRTKDKCGRYRVYILLSRHTGSCLFSHTVTEYELLNYSTTKVYERTYHILNFAGTVLRATLL